MSKPDAHKWEFKPRFRRHAFGWRSQPAILRVRQAVAEIKKVARKDAVVAAEGAVTFLERVSPALENIDSSSGAIGIAVNRAIEELVSVIARASADETTREAWLERLWEAHANDDIPYIEKLAEYWGDLCASKGVASAWADRLVDTVKLAWSPDPELRGYFHGASACLSALYGAERYEELVALLELDRLRFWPYRRWGAKALAAVGKRAEAIRYAEDCRGPSTPGASVARVCEGILLASGLADEAYARYAIEANPGTSYLATFRTLTRKYPHKSPNEILEDLVASTPGEEGKWFAAAKEASFLDVALRLATTTPCDPRTLTRAARDHIESNPTFALGAGLAALRWLAEGYGFDITGADVWAAYSNTMKAAERVGKAVEIKSDLRALAASTRGGTSFVAEVLGQELGLP